MSTFCRSVGTSFKKPAINLVFNVSRQGTNLFFFCHRKQTWFVISGDAEVYISILIDLPWLVCRKLGTCFCTLCFFGDVRLELIPHHSIHNNMSSTYDSRLFRKAIASY